MLGKVLGFLTRPPVPFVLGILLLLALLWFGGGFMQSRLGWPSTTWIVAACVAVVVVAVLYVVLRAVRARAKARAIENEIRNQGRAQAASLPPGTRDEFDALQSRFDEALAALKASKLGRGALYAMPWFVVIGPPGSGKTTAITESGLNFPAVKGPSQKRGIRGVGGTRNCDWWFTDQAILLDTAGRYTTQAEDRDEWLAFLGMLKKARKLKPINGALVALSITDVLEADEDGLERHAATIRQRIDELVKQLEVVFPVYLMLTKCDLLDGFVEFFQSLSKEERAQVWGTTFDRTDAGEVHERFAREFDLLCRQVDVERSRLLVADRPAMQQQKIFSLPLQLRAAKRKLTEFVRLLTQPNPYSDASELRGVYLTSGTQEGAPIDLVLKKLSAAFGVATRVETGPKPVVEQKSYFLRDVFTRVMQADRELARSSAKVQRRRELGRKVLVFGSAVAAIAGAVWAVTAWSDSRARIAEFGAARSAGTGIVVDRKDEPSEEAKQKLNRLRDGYVALEQAYGTTSLLGPRRGVITKAMGDYAGEMRKAFLEPIAARVKEKLKSYVDSPPDKRGDFTSVNQLVNVYDALGGGFVSSDTLRAALLQQNLWRWAPDAIGAAADVLATSEQSKHLETYLAARVIDPRTWSVAVDQEVLGNAQRLRSSGSELGNAVDKVIADSDQIRGATEQDIQKLVKEQIEKVAGAIKMPPDEFATMVSASRRAKVLADMSAVRLRDSSSLRGVVESLSDLAGAESETLKKFEECLGRLRLAGAAPGTLGTDPVRTAYANALQQIASVREDLAMLERQRGPQGYVLTDVLKGRMAWFDQFAAKWNVAQENVDRELKTLDKELAADTGEQGKLVMEPVRVSLGNMSGGVIAALARAAREEMQEHWRQTVATKLAAACACFPCDRLGETELAEADFTELFKPGGLLDTQFGVIRKLGDIKVLGGTLVLADDFASFRNSVLAIQSACFAADPKERARLLFKVTKITRDQVVRNVKLVIATGNEVSQDDGSMSKIANAERRWGIGQTGAQLVLDTVIMVNNEARKLTVPSGAASTSAWGLLRVLRAGVSEPVGNATKVTWTVTYPRDDRTTGTTVCWIQFEPVGTENPLRPEFFDLKPPVKIFQGGP